MRTATAHERHRAHDTRQGALCVVNVRGGAILRSIGVVCAVSWCSMTLGACRGAFPRPPAAQVSAEDYVAVPFSPRVPPLEIVPPAPTKDAVWVDGSWEWSANRYGWRYGSWVVPPPGVRRARWAIVRRKADGQLFFAPACWKDASGKSVDDRTFWNALGPAARARPRLGAPPPSETGQRARGRGTDEPVAPTYDTGDDEDE